ncbi:MAG TPA: hypothetical protein ENJ41_02800 [Oceanospirillales bacterium]|nr:hypothetical protein [Oceanospirillales bacterium]
MKKRHIFSLIFSCLMVTQVNAKNKLSFDQTLSISSNKAHSFFADVGAGSLQIRGAHVDTISVNATVYSEKYHDIEELREVFNDKVLLTLVKKGSTIELKAMVKRGRWLSFKDPEIAIDLDIIVPTDLNIEIDDGSGSLQVVDIEGNLEIDDGSGSMTINNIGGDVLIDDGSGNLKLSTVAGNVNIDDGSGNLILNDISGDVFIDDGSGVVNIDGVRGNVTIDDSSGSINIYQLAGHFNLIDDGSGNVMVNGRKWQRD